MSRSIHRSAVMVFLATSCVAAQPPTGKAVPAQRRASSKDAGRRAQERMKLELRSIDHQLHILHERFDIAIGGMLFRKGYRSTVALPLSSDTTFRTKRTIKFPTTKMHMLGRRGTRHHTLRVEIEDLKLRVTSKGVLQLGRHKIDLHKRVKFTVFVKSDGSVTHQSLVLRSKRQVWRYPPVSESILAAIFSNHVDPRAELVPVKPADKKASLADDTNVPIQWLSVATGNYKGNFAIDVAVCNPVDEVKRFYDAYDAGNPFAIPHLQPRIESRRAMQTLVNRGVTIVYKSVPADCFQHVLGVGLFSLKHQYGGSSRFGSHESMVFSASRGQGHISIPLGTTPVTIGLLDRGKRLVAGGRDFDVSRGHTRLLIKPDKTVELLSRK